ncbi:MAG: hypothetical protein LHW57_08170 [Candidatus Cloacimonetes bacterium]|nr:hypothetical protein [Candidatus Cloacimonadota bacterium]
MSIFLDIIGSVIIGSMVLLMLITFQFRTNESAERFIYSKEMIAHIDQAATQLNHVIALAGVGFEPKDTVVHATADSLVFNTYWNFETNSLELTPLTISIKVSEFPTPIGRALVVLQNNEPVERLGYIFYVEDLEFRYFDKYDAQAVNKTNVRSTEMWITFSRTPPVSGTADLRNRIQLKCYFMNAYMRGA